MPDDWDSDIAAVRGTRGTTAQTNVTAARGIGPDAAAAALKHGPTVGVAPSMAVQDPKPVVDMALSRRDTTILNDSSHVASWAANDPIKVAATQDDFPSLASIGSRAKEFYTQLNRRVTEFGQQRFEATGLLKNLTDPIAGTFHALPRDIPRLAPLFASPFDKTANRLDAAKAAGSVAGEALNLFPLVGAFSSVANAAYIQPAASIFDLLPPKEGQSKAEQHRKNVEMVGLSLFGLSPTRSFRPPPVIEEGNVTPQDLRLEGPREPVIDAEFDPVPGFDPTHTLSFQEAVKTDLEHVKGLQDVVAESATQTRSPELMEDYLNNHTPAGESVVSVPPEAIAKLWADGHSAFPSYAQQVSDGLVTGADIKVPLGTYLAETSGKPFAEELLAVTRFRDNGVSQEEADTLPEDLRASKEEIEGKPGVNVRRMAGMLGPQLYGDPEVTAQVTAKEVLQNSFDAIKSLMADNGLFKGKIDISFDRDERRMVFHDNGIGMAPDLLGGKFLQIAGSEKGENASGGFGIAKMLFLYGNNELHVQTLKDGVYSEMKTSGPDLMNALEEGGKQPKIQVLKGDEVSKKIKELFPEGHGTRISLQIPEHYTDTKTGEKLNIPFPYDPSDIPALKNSPLFADVDVRFKGRYDSEHSSIEGIGASFPAEQYTTFGNVKFPWGTARIYISKEPAERSWDAGLHILSNGLWQFTEKLPANPNEPYGKALPFNIFLDVNPNVKPEQPGYPFGFNRQAFTENAASDVKQVKQYIQATYSAKMLSDEAAQFGSVRYLDQDYGYSSPIDLNPTLPQSENAFDLLQEGDAVEVRQGQLFVNGKAIPTMTPEELKSAIPSTDELRIDQKLIDSNRVMIHDNTTVPGEATADNPFPDERSFSQVMAREFGKRWEQFELTVGYDMLALRDAVARIMKYPDLRKEAIGISYDKDYRGVSIKVPFEGMFINPVAAEGNTPSEQAYGIVGTMIHEFAHHKVRSHNDRFAAEMQRILYKLQGGTDEFDFQQWQQGFVAELVGTYSDILTRGKEAFNESSVENRGRSFKEPSYESTGDGGDEGLSGELAPARQGTEGSGELPGRDGGGPEDRGGGETLPGVSAAPAPGVGGNAGADSIGDFVGSVTEAVATVRRGVKQVEAELGLARVITDAKSAGMTAKQFKGYSAALEQWERETEEKLVKRMVKQFHKEHGPDWKAAVELQLEEATNAIEGLTSVQAYRSLSDPALKLDRVALEDYEGLTVPKALTKADGLAPDEAAELAGYETGGQLVQALNDLQQAIDASGSKSLDAYIKMRARVFATEQARVMTGYDMSPEAVMQHVLEEVNSPIIENLLVDELQAYAEANSLPFDKDSLKAIAQQAFGKLTVREGLNTKSFAANVRRYGNKAEEGLLGSKADDAFRAKQKQFIQFSMIQQSLALVKDYAKTQKKFNRWAKKASNKNIDQAYMNYVHAELFRMGYRVRRDFAEMMDQIGNGKLLDFIMDKELQGKEIFYEPFPGVPLERMSVTEYQAARDTLSSLIHNGRVEAGVVILGKRASLADLLARVKENGDKLGRKLSPKKLEERSGVKQLASAVNAYMIKGEQLLDEADLNDPQGPLNQAVNYPLQESQGRENDMLANVTNQLKAFGKTQPKNWLGTMKVKIDVPELQWTNPATGLPEKVLTTRGKLVKLMLNLGNEVNLSKLLEGYGWEYGDVMTAVYTHARKADWDFVQKVWDLHEELWPEVVRVYRNLAGVAPRRRTPAPIQTPFGIYNGGYFPVSYDKLRSPGVRVMSNDSIWGEEYASGLPANPYTKGVTAYVAPLDLTFEGLNKSLGQVIHDLAFREALSQSVRVLGDDIVRKSIQANFGPSYTAQLRPWLEYIARQRVFDDRSAGFIENFFAGLRSNITFVGLAYRRTSAIIHGTVALSDSVAEVGAKDFAAAALDIIKTPGQFNYWMDYISKNSPEVRHRMLNMDQNIREAMIHLTEKQGFLEEAQKFGYHMLALSDIISAAPTWLAALRRATNTGKYSPEEAFLIADKELRRAHGSSSPVNIAAVQRGGQGFWAEVGKSSFGLFLSFMNHAYNRLWAIGRRFGLGFEEAKAGDWAGASRDWSKASAMSFFYVIVPAVLVTMEKTWFKTGSPIPHKWMDWVDGVAHTTFGGLPGVGTLIEAVERKESESPLERAVSTNVQTAQNAWNKATGHDGKVSKRWLQQAMESAGYWTGKVPGAIAKDTQYIWDVSTGAERPPKDMNEFLHVLATGGRAKK